LGGHPIQSIEGSKLPRFIVVQVGYLAALVDKDKLQFTKKISKQEVTK
jgi:hypothetical protein